MYIKDLPDNLVSDPKLFADDTSHCLVVGDEDLSEKNLNGDLN